jgi:hypothetical protein
MKTMRKVLKIWPPFVLLVRKGILAYNGEISRGIYSYTLLSFGFHVRYGILFQYRDTIIPLQFNLVTAHHEPKLS